MKTTLAALICLLFAGLALAQGEQTNPQTQEQGKFKSSETFTYTLPQSFSSEADEPETKKDQERRKKLIEDIRKLYQANFI
ncbi:MAG: hypothetical protein KDD46_04795 [Bdellovibrionales bacterium]|nr:hypothetical protein [Bdellovibrionales bacterium]